MTEHPGVPASERAELAGLKYQSARERDALHEAVTSLSLAAASRPSVPALARAGAARAGHRVLLRLQAAVPPSRWASMARPFQPGTTARAVLPPAAAAAVLTVAAAAAFAWPRHRQ